MEIEGFHLEEPPSLSGEEDNNESEISPRLDENQNGVSINPTDSKASENLMNVMESDPEMKSVPKNPLSRIRKVGQSSQAKRKNTRKKVVSSQLIVRNSSTDLNNNNNIRLLFGQEQKIPELITIERPLHTPRVFFIAGDILVELSSMDPESDGFSSHSPILNEFRNIVSIEQRGLTLAVELESVSPIMQMGIVVECLERSQNQQNYQFAQIIRIYENAVNLLALLINLVIKSTPESELETLLAARKSYRDSVYVKELERLSGQDEFCILGNMSLSFVNRTLTMSKVGFSSALIAAAGANPSQLQVLFMRKGFMNSMNFAARRLLFARVMQQQQPQTRNQKLEIEGFEFITLDGIKIICRCVLESNFLQFPPELEFKGEPISRLNNIETMFSIKLLIENTHIERILRIRSENIEQVPNSLARRAGISEIQEHLDIFCLEYAVISTEFLKKFYKSKADVKVEGKRICRIGPLAQRIHSKF